MHVHHLSLSVICVLLAIGCEEERVNELGLAEAPQRDSGINLGGQEMTDSERAREASGEEARGGEVSGGEISDEGAISGDINAGSLSAVGGSSSSAGEEVIAGALDVIGGSSSSVGEETGGSSSDQPDRPDQPDQPYGDVTPASVLCGEETCDLATHTCCLREFGARCVEGANAACDLGGTPLICDGPEDCGGGSCCLGVGLPGALECSPTPCVNLTLCHVDADCAEDQVCRRCQFTGVELSVCARPNIIPNLALSCE